MPEGSTLSKPEWLRRMHAQADLPPAVSADQGSKANNVSSETS